MDVRACRRCAFALSAEGCGATKLAHDSGGQNARVSCGYTDKYSFVLIANDNMNQGKKRVACRWKCVYRTASGAPHVNAGERTNIPYMKTFPAARTLKSAPGIVAAVSAAGSCL